MTEDKPFRFPSDVQERINAGKKLGIQHIAHCGKNENRQPVITFYGLWRVVREKNTLEIQERTLENPEWTPSKNLEEWPDIPLMAIGSRTFDSNHIRRNRQKVLKRIGAHESKVDPAGAYFWHKEAYEFSIAPINKHGVAMHICEGKVMSKPFWHEGMLDARVVSLMCRLFPQQSLFLSDYMMVIQHQKMIEYWADKQPNLLSLLPSIPKTLWSQNDLFSTERWIGPECPITNTAGFKKPEAAQWWLNARPSVVKSCKNPQQAERIHALGVAHHAPAIQRIMAEFLNNQERRERFLQTSLNFGGLLLLSSPEFTQEHENKAVEWTINALKDWMALTGKRSSYVMGDPGQSEMWVAFTKSLCWFHKTHDSMAYPSPEYILPKDHPWFGAISSYRLAQSMIDHTEKPTEQQAQVRRHRL